VDSNFASGAAIWQIRPNNVVFDSGPMVHWPHYVKARRHPQNQKYITYCTVVRELTKPRPQVTGTEDLVKFGRGFRNMRNDRHSKLDRQTNGYPVCIQTYTGWAKKVIHLVQCNVMYERYHFFVEIHWPQYFANLQGGRSKNWPSKQIHQTKKFMWIVLMHLSL